MKFAAAKLSGAFVIEIEPIEDERGFFARTFCVQEFKAHGLNFEIIQSSISHNAKKGTIRGMHYQVSPHEESKLIRCTRGAIHDVFVDIRRQSPTYRQWESVTLTAENRKMLYLPPGFAHGFQSLEDDTEVSYQISNIFVPEAARGLRWDDPALGIAWPLPVSVISERDRNYPKLEEETRQN